MCVFRGNNTEMTTVLLRLGAQKIKVETLLVIKVHQFSGWETFYSGQVRSHLILLSLYFYTPSLYWE